jgi:hypothetical protein
MLYSVIFKDLTDSDIQTIGKRFNPPLKAIVGARLNAQETRDAINSLTAVNNEALILDLDAVDENVLIDSMHVYRVQRSETRIIIYASGRIPGNVVLAQLVAMGIYDILAPDKSEDADLVEVLTEVLERPVATYAQAYRFSGAGVNFSVAPAERKTITQTRVIEKFVETQRPIGLVTIAVTGAFTGAGCTHVALAVSSFIAQTGHKVILAGRPGVESLECNSIIHVLDGREGDIEGCATVRGIDIFFDVGKLVDISDIFTRIQGLGYQYLVLDMGCLDTGSRYEMNRADLPVLVASASYWRLHHLASLVQYNNAGVQNWTVIANAPSKANFDYFRKMFGEHMPRLEALPFFPDPFNLEEHISADLSRLLAVVLPGPSRQRKKSWLPWKQHNR